MASLTIIQTIIANDYDLALAAQQLWVRGYLETETLINLKGEVMIGELSGDTADFLNEIPWFDGIIYIILLMGLYVFYKWVNKKFR